MPRAECSCLAVPGAVGGLGVEESLFKPVLSCVLVGDAVSFEISEDQNDLNGDERKSRPKDGESSFPVDRRCFCFQVVIVTSGRFGPSCQADPSRCQQPRLLAWSWQKDLALSFLVRLE